jgi:hypothetical protein
MEIKVRFRFNKATGEVELFEVDDVGPMRLPEAEHNREHDRIASQLGNVIERNPRVMEVAPGTLVPIEETTPEPAAAEPEIKTEKDKQGQS